MVGKWGQPVDIAPSWSTSVGDSVYWVQGDVIANIIVPDADVGIPIPAYSASGLPAGINFDINTRTISGTPTAIGSGTIIITATNGSGTGDRTIAYATAVGASQTIPIPASLYVASGSSKLWLFPTPLPQINSY